jgi:hypothetical protein
MKKIILIQIVSFLIVGTAYAQNATIYSVNGQQIENTKQKIAGVRQNAQETIKNARELASSTRASTSIEIKGRRAEIKTAVQELVEQKIENRINQVKENALRDFDITVRNLDNLNLRISSRIEKLEASGTISIAEPRSLLEIASTSIENVRIAVEDFRATDFSTSSIVLGGNLTQTTEKALTQPIKDKIKEIKNLIKDAHSALVNVVASIVKGQVIGTTTTE